MGTTGAATRGTVSLRRKTQEALSASYPTGPTWSDNTRLEFSFPADGDVGEDGFGFGVRVGKLGGEVAWSRAGEHLSGYGAAFVYLPELKVLSIALTNARPASPGRTAEFGAEYAAEFNLEVASAE